MCRGVVGDQSVIIAEDEEWRWPRLGTTDWHEEGGRDGVEGLGLDRVLFVYVYVYVGMGVVLLVVSPPRLSGGLVRGV